MQACDIFKLVLMKHTMICLGISSTCNAPQMYSYRLINVTNTSNTNRPQLLTGIDPERWIGHKSKTQRHIAKQMCTSNVYGRKVLREAVPFVLGPKSLGNLQTCHRTNRHLFLKYQSKLRSSGTETF